MYPRVGLLKSNDWFKKKRKKKKKKINMMGLFWKIKVFF